MSTMMKLSLGAALALALVTTPMEAHAAGVMMDASELPAATRTSLAQEIARARAQTPDLFKQVYDVAARANATDQAARRQGIPLTMDLKALGPRALMPMLEMLAFDGHAPADLTPSAAQALRMGLVEAVGLVKDTRAVPVLARVIAKAQDRENDLDLAHVAADALGRIGSDEAFAALNDALTASAGSKEKTRAVLAGFGSARRVASAKLLAKTLDAHPDEATARTAVKALGAVGNAWAWKTLGARQEEAATRETAARALVRAYVAYGGDVREAAAKAFLVVDHADAAAMIADAKGRASQDNAAALDALSQRLAKNPTR